MLDIKYIRDHKAAMQEVIQRRGLTVDLEALLTLDDRRRVLINQVEKLRGQRNLVSKTKPSPKEIEAMRQLGDELTLLERELDEVQGQFKELALKIPNQIHPAVPSGGEADFKVVASVGEPPQFDFKPKDHEELLTTLDLIDFERGAKVSGTKFYFSKGDLVRLNQALINYGIEVVTKHGFKLLETPDLVKNEVITGAGYNPRGPETQIYSIEKTDLSLIGTAEISVGGYHANEILDLTTGPKKYAALSHCFRTEAGAYGKTSKGLYRVHQFTKLEMFAFCQPEDSEGLHEQILAIERELADGLELPYRVIEVAAQDLGAPAIRKFDIEAWMVMKNDYGEITSASNCTDFQARRLNIRYRTVEGDTRYVHTLNGTAVVTSRLPLVLVENFQNKDGTISLPKVLQKYLGGQTQLGRET